MAGHDDQGTMGGVDHGVYRGVRTDWMWMAHSDPEVEMGAPIYCADMPFSFVVDTLILPFDSVAVTQKALAEKSQTNTGSASDRAHQDTFAMLHGLIEQTLASTSDCGPIATNGSRYFEVKPRSSSLKILISERPFGTQGCHYQDIDVDIKIEGESVGANFEKDGAAQKCYAEIVALLAN